MSLFSNLLTGPLYVIIVECDEDFEVIDETREAVEVWGLFEDGTALVRDVKPTPSCLRYARPISGDPTLFFSWADAKQALDKADAVGLSYVDSSGVDA